MRWSSILFGIVLLIVGMTCWLPVIGLTDSILEQIKFDLTHNYVAIAIMTVGVALTIFGLFKPTSR